MCACACTYVLLCQHSHACGQACTYSCICRVQFSLSFLLSSSVSTPPFSSALPPAVTNLPLYSLLLSGSFSLNGLCCFTSEARRHTTDDSPGVRTFTFDSPARTTSKGPLREIPSGCFPSCPVGDRHYPLPSTEPDSPLEKHNCSLSFCAASPLPPSCPA